MKVITSGFPSLWGLRDLCKVLECRMLVTIEFEATSLSKHGHGLEGRSVRKVQLIGMTLGHESHNLRSPFPLGPQGPLQSLGVHNGSTVELKATSLSKRGHGLQVRNIKKAELIAVTSGHESHNPRFPFPPSLRDLFKVLECRMVVHLSKKQPLFQTWS